MKIDVQEFRKPCACGRTHEIVVDDMIIEKGAIQRLPHIMKTYYSEYKTIAMLCDDNTYAAAGKLVEIVVDDMIIEKGAIQRLPHIMKTYYSEYKTIAMLCDDNTYAAAGKLVEELLPGIITIRLNPENLHADEHGVEAAQKQLDKYAGIDFLIAAGSGTIHDITRYHAYEKKLPFLSIPTAASVDGYVSTVAAMTWHGFKKSFTAVSPRFVLADSEIFSKAPLRLTASGVADLLGKFTALCDWRIAHALTSEYICDTVVDMEYKVLKELCENLDGIRNHDLSAYENLMYGLLLSGIAMQMIGNSRPASGAEHHMSLCENLDGIRNHDLSAYENLMYGLLLSGIAMQMIGNSRPASGAEHHMSHLWEMSAINEPIDYYHGEKVGVGLCMATAVYKKAEQKLRAGGYQVKDHMELETEFIKANITSPILQEEILKENTPNLMADITGNMLKEKEADILTILADLPDAQTMIGWMKKVHGLTTMQELTLDEVLKTTTQRLSPYVRQRLTFMRLLKFYDFYDEITEG